jgi:hypothetical protein
VSTTATSAASDEWTAPAIGNLQVAAAIIGFFVLACVGSATRSDVTTGFDEPAHASYVAQIQKTGDAWPDLTRLRLLDPHTFEFTGEPNYLNHPPLFYALLAAIGPKLEGRPQALLAYRLFDVALVAAGLAALLALSLLAPFSRAEFYAYAMPLVWIPILVQLGATVTNDDLAFFGGALATLGVWQLVATGRGLWLARSRAYWHGRGGVGEADRPVAHRHDGRCGADVSAVARPHAPELDDGRRRRARPRRGAVYYFRLAVWQSDAGNAGPDRAPSGRRASRGLDRPAAQIFSPLPRFLHRCLHRRLDAGPRARSASNYAMLAIPAAALVCALAGAALSLRRLWLRRETPRDVLYLRSVPIRPSSTPSHFDCVLKFPSTNAC